MQKKKKEKKMKATTFHLSLLHTATKSRGRTGTRDDSAHDQGPHPSTLRVPRVDCFSDHTWEKLIWVITLYRKVQFFTLLEEKLYWTTSRTSVDEHVSYVKLCGYKLARLTDIILQYRPITDVCFGVNVPDQGCTILEKTDIAFCDAYCDMTYFRNIHQISLVYFINVCPSESVKWLYNRPTSL